MKKSISLLLSCTMVISMVSTTAFAADSEIQNELSTNQEYVIKEDGTRNGSVTMEDVNELFFELDKAVLMEDEESAAAIRKELENAGAKQVTLAEILAKTGGANSAIAPLAADDIEFRETHTEIVVDGETLEIMHIRALPDIGSNMFHQKQIRIDAEPDMRAGALNMFEVSATFLGGELPKVGTVISAFTAISDIFSGFSAQEIVEVLDVSYDLDLIENTAFMYFWNENTNNWTHIGTGNYVPYRLIPRTYDIITNEDKYANEFSGESIPTILGYSYQYGWDNAKIHYEFWEHYGPCTIYQVDEVTVAVPDGEDSTRDYEFSMKCPLIPALCS